MSFLDALPDYGAAAQPQQPVASSSFLDALPEYAGKPQPVTQYDGAPGATFDERFGAQPATQPSPTAGLLTDFENQGAAAGQRTTPVLSAQAPNLLSSDVYQNDAGEAMYRDPNTGQMVTTDQAKHVILRDPTDQKLKVYARTDNTNEGAIASLGRVLGTGLATNAPTRIPGGAAMMPFVKSAPTTEELKAAAQAGYGADAVTGLTLTPDALIQFGQKLRTGLNAKGLDENLAPKTFAILGKTDAAPAADAAVTGQNLESLRRAFGNAAQSVDPTERMAARTAIDALDEHLAAVPKDQVVSGAPEEAANVLAEARGNYAAAKRSDKIGELTEKAENNARGANSGQNLDNATRQQIKTILNDPAKRRGYSMPELALMKRIVSGSYTGDTLRAVGNLLGGGGGHGMLTTAVMGGVAGHEAGGLMGAAAGASLPAVGYLAKKMGNALTAGKVQQLDTLIRSNSPLGRQMYTPVQQWSKVAQAYEAGVTPRSTAMLALASRNLANNLADVGITINPRQLIGAVQGLQYPSSSNADGDQR